MVSKTEMKDAVPFDVGLWTELNRLRTRKLQSEPGLALLCGPRQWNGF